MIARHHRTPIMHRVVEHGGLLYLGGMVAEDKSLPMKGQTEQALSRIGALGQALRGYCRAAMRASDVQAADDEAAHRMSGTARFQLCGSADSAVDAIGARDHRTDVQKRDLR